jgi:chromosome segregation ATPase
MATKPKEKNAAEQHVDTLREKYDKLAAKVSETAPNTPERHKAMEDKKAAFIEYNAASDAQQKAQIAADQAEQKQSAAEGAAREAAEAKKHATDVAKHPEKATAPAGPVPTPTPRPVGKET